MKLRQRLKCLFCGCQIKAMPFKRLKELEEEIEKAPNGSLIRVNDGELEIVNWVHKPKQYIIGCDD